MHIPEIMFRKILYTTDLSEAGRSAFGYAASLCRRYGSELTVFHAVDQMPDLAKELVGYIDEQLWQEIKQRDLKEAQQILNDRKRDNVTINNAIGDYCEAVQTSTPDKTFVTYKIEIQIGNPVQCITAYAEEGGYDLIIMGHVSQSTIQEAVIGSTVRRVIRKSKIPILVIRTE